MVRIENLIPESMIGDTNLFFANEDSKVVAEAEIMIAEQNARGARRGWEAMLLMFLYGINYIGVKQYVVKISFHNPVSLSMFMKMGFIETGRSEVFEEVTMEKVVENQWVGWLKSQVVMEVIKEVEDCSEFQYGLDYRFMYLKKKRIHGSKQV